MEIIDSESRWSRRLEFWVTACWLQTSGNKDRERAMDAELAEKMREARARRERKNPDDCRGHS